MEVVSVVEIPNEILEGVFISIKEKVVIMQHGEDENNVVNFKGSKLELLKEQLILLMVVVNIFNH